MDGKRATDAGSGGRQLLSVVVPCYDEEPVIAAFHERLAAAVDGLGLDVEIVYVNDGSRDGTVARLADIRARDGRVSLVDLSRNFGKEIALTAGLDHARGDAVVVIDADLQDPPELIADLVAGWREGYDVVYAQRLTRQGETATKKLTAHLFYRIMRRVGRVQIPADTGDFRLLSRRALDALLAMREQHRFMKGLFSWIGFPQKAVPYHRDPRFAGETKWNYWRLWNFSIEGITPFTIGPLKIATYLGVVIALAAFVYGLFIIVQTLVFGNPVPGYPSILVVVLILGGFQLMTLGIIGEYLGRIFNETKRRPLYFVREYQPPRGAEGAAHPPVRREDRRRVG
ncbi:MAG: glycosyltransferase family 2 protein [Alphaproteobacteria bacterium]|nr:glycosyltransferase family 2 protein [Alphaproteobacteria bacterium]